MRTLCLAVGFSAAALAAQAPPTSGTLWPTSGWTKATPESQGLSVAKLAAIDKEIRDGIYGNVDRVVVARAGRLVLDEKYPRDYAAMSRGRVGPIGCGDGCTDPARMHEFNYFHPNNVRGSGPFSGPRARRQHHPGSHLMT